MKIYLVGDSHSQVLFPNLVRKLEADGNIIVGAESRAGWSAKRFIDSDVKSRIKSAKPDVTIFSLGGNNRDLDLSSYRDTVRQIRSGIGKSIWLGPFPSTVKSVSDRHLWTDDALKKILPSSKYLSMMNTSISGLSSDGVHFTPSSYRAIINENYAAISEKLKSNFLLPILAIGLGAFIYSFSKR